MLLNHNLFVINEMIYYLLSEKLYMYHNGNVSVRMNLRSFESWANLSQQCVPVGIHLELINKELMLLVTI